MGDLKLNFLLSMFRFQIWRHAQYQRVRRVLHCHRGHHDVYSQSKEVYNSREGRLRSSWLACKNCNFIFFPSAHYKKNYLRMKQRELDMWKNVFTKMVKDTNNLEYNKKVKP